jgi:hypothetical protein
MSFLIDEVVFKLNYIDDFWQAFRLHLLHDERKAGRIESELASLQLVFRVVFAATNALQHGLTLALDRLKFLFLQLLDCLLYLQVEDLFLLLPD